MNVAEFIAKWKQVELKERSAAQEHFIDLCRLVGHPTPAEDDPTGERFCFEKGAEKHGAGGGFADVWKKDFFGWEYKGKDKDLSKAYDQLLLYRDALANPPLLVVCDLDRIIIHTNFTKTASDTHEILLEELGEARNIEILQALFFHPERLRPGQTSEAITEKAAQQFADIAESMRQRGLDSAEVAHFLDRVVFCLFAEDIELLPNQIFTRIADRVGTDPSKFCRYIGQLFAAMSTGGDFLMDPIRHFNGNLFDGSPVPDLIPLEIQRITESAHLDWSSIEPSIFGTLFERGLDPAKRAQLGAHFTSKEDIETLVDVVVMQPLRREWDETRKTVETLLATGKKRPGPAPEKPLSLAKKKKAMKEGGILVQRFLTHLQSIKVLDPACGSGNFLYVSLQKLKDFEKAIILYSMEALHASFFPMIGPWQLHGIELNPYAHDLAQMTVWIGWLQWIKFNGFGSPEEPILRNMTANFQCKDSILDLSDPEHPAEPDWPKVDFIVGNPPFLGDKMMRRELGGEYVEQLRALYKGRIPGQSDLCCYWFEKARATIEKGECKRAGLLATQGIRGGANREVLKRIQESGNIFWAISDQNWILDGANVHVSFAAFDNGTEETKALDGQSVSTINANLSSSADITRAKALLSQKDICYQGPVKVGQFDIDDDFALDLIAKPNPHGKPNSDIIIPWLNGRDITTRTRNCWIIDFANFDYENASQYEAPFKYIEQVVRPKREGNADKQRREYWWRLGRSGKDWKRAIHGLSRTIFSPRVAKHRIFVWSIGTTLPDSAVVGFARSDDLMFGSLNSRIHLLWAFKQGTQLREKESGARYTPTTCFETFPMPEPTPEQEQAIAESARELNELRERWLNPPEWTREEILEFPGTPDGPWARFIEPGTTTVRYPRLVPKDAESETLLKKRTLTRLYNERPTWLDLAHKKLDEAVFAAYGWDPEMTDDDLLTALLALNLERSKS